MKPKKHSCFQRDVRRIAGQKAKTREVGLGRSGGNPSCARMLQKGLPKIDEVAVEGCHDHDGDSLPVGSNDGVEEEEVLRKQSDREEKKVLATVPQDPHCLVAPHMTCFFLSESVSAGEEGERAVERMGSADGEGL